MVGARVVKIRSCSSNSQILGRPLGNILNFENSLKQCSFQFRSIGAKRVSDEKMHDGPVADFLTLTLPFHLFRDNENSSHSSLLNFISYVPYWPVPGLNCPTMPCSKVCPRRQSHIVPPMRVTEDLLTFPRLKFLWLCLLWATSPWPVHGDTDCSLLVKSLCPLITEKGWT